MDDKTLVPPPGETLLVNLSGGIDSTYCLYQALRDGYKVLAHHIELKNNQNRHIMERAAVTRVKRLIKQDGYSFRLLKSGFDLGTIPHRPSDLWVWSFFTGVILAAPGFQHINWVAISSHLDSPFMMDEERDKRRKEIVFNTANREVNFYYPIGQMLKKEVVAKIPTRYLNASWYCRVPQRDRPCRRCETCHQVQEGLEYREFLQNNS